MWKDKQLKNSKHVFLLVTFFIMLTSACSYHNSDLETQIFMLTHNRIVCDYDSLLFVGGNPMKQMNEPINYNLTIYFDSTECSSCSINNIYQWTDLIEQLNKKQKSIRTTFIFSPPRTDLRRVIYLAQHSQFRNGIYIDTCSYFIRANPHIPSNNLMHTFLLNDKDSVILVGNPQSNPKIKELLFHILEESKQ